MKMALMMRDEREWVRELEARRQGAGRAEAEVDVVMWVMRDIRSAGVAGGIDAEQRLMAWLAALGVGVAAAVAAFGWVAVSSASDPLAGVAASWAMVVQ